MSDQNNSNDNVFDEAPESLDLNTKKPNFIGMIFLLFGILFLGFLLYSENFSDPVSDNNADEFTTSPFKVKEIVEKAEKAEPPKIIVIEPEVIAPPQPKPEPVPYIIPTIAPVAVIPEVKKEVCDTVCQQRIDDLNKRLQSPSVIMDGSGSTADNHDENQPNNTAPSAGTGGQNSFLKVASVTKDLIKATINRRIDALIPQGTMINGILETAINSDLPGQVRAITTDDVWSFDGRRILIPQGTSVIGEYKTGIEHGQSRVLIIWTRLLRSDGVSIALNSYGTDNLGMSGLTGYVDEHYIQRFGSAILLSMVSAGAKYLDGSSFGGTPAADELSKTTQSLAKMALADSLDIPPTITVNQGALISIFVRQDLDFSELYDDPVTEEYKKIINGNR